MTTADQIKFHSDRALAELDLARIASSSLAAEAHLKLSSLHVEKIRALAPVPASRA